jgi:hypothetical protein
MLYLRTKIMKWKRKWKKKPKHTKIDDFSDQLFDAIHENDFELAKIIIDDGKLDANIKDDCVNTPLTAVCQQTTLKIEEEAIEFINYLWKNDTKFKTFKGLEKTATNYAESNGLRKIMDNLDCIQRKILDENLCNVGLI